MVVSRSVVQSGETCGIFQWPPPSLHHNMVVSSVLHHHNGPYQSIRPPYASTGLHPSVSGVTPTLHQSRTHLASYSRHMSYTLDMPGHCLKNLDYFLALFSLHGTGTGTGTVSYTHLTLPTKRIV